MFKNRKKMVSVIITTKNEELIINVSLKSIKKQTYRNIEIILVDNFSTDRTIDIASKYTKSIFQFGPERSAQRNFGAKKAKGDFLFFLDADMELTPLVIENCIKIVDKSKIEAVVVPEESKWSNFWGKVKAFERSFYNENGDPITDAARFFSKELFFEMGGYDESITGPEDWDLPDRIKERGYEIGRSDQKIFHHEQNIYPMSLLKKKFYYGMNAHKYLSKHKIPVVSPKTIYFLRPLFYKNWYKLLLHPFLSIAMIYMLSLELLGGGLGYLIGRIKK